ncbi:membrane integrity-associated transporter subunit PqiC [Alcaligenes faecalis]|uniref:PqiC family protein n=1 Tax=Alcaligenes faecalis TaxID=511 RepID=UPI001C8379E5|nr:PqiC family protein [Alcaligenes faecalis]MBX6965816.1 membrane integrity-associated transporter subunit PqiC [Providencia rettgeri]MBX7031380.1 membrane integrity-associated transporter subunit PqiC [Alcaligenes faecalis]
MMSRFLIPVAFAGLLTACASTTPTYYTLQASNAAPAAAPAAQAWKGFQLRRMDVPAQLDRRSFVLTQTAGGQVNLLNDSQWASPLPDEMSLALVSGLQDRLGVPQLASAAPKTPLWQIDVLVQRFESVYGERATLELSWTLTPVGFEGNTQQCRWLDSESASSVPELVQAHRQLQQRWADALAAQMQGKPVPVNLGKAMLCAS